MSGRFEASRRPPIGGYLVVHAVLWISAQWDAWSHGGGRVSEGLSGDDAAAFRAVGHQRAYGANVTLVHQGDDVGPVIVLLRGKVKIVKIAEAGREAIVSVREEGDLVAELAAIDDGPRSTSVTTLGPVEALMVPRSEFTLFLEQRPHVALVVLRIVAARLRYAGAQQAQFGTHDVLGRLAQRLLELSERFGVRHERGIDVEPLLQEDLASWIGASREAVSKAFQTLRPLRIVETGRRRVTILDLEALAHHARSAWSGRWRDRTFLASGQHQHCTKDAPCTPSTSFPPAVSTERPSLARSSAA